MLKKFIKGFTKEKIINFDKVKRIGDKHFLVEDEALLKKNPSYIGTYLGENQKKHFIPSFILLDLIAPHTKQKLTVDEKTAWLFVCKRDICPSIPESFENKSLIIVINAQNEVLGFGIIDLKGQFKIKNLLDRGDFLRRER